MRDKSVGLIMGYELVSIISRRQGSFGLYILGWRRLHSMRVAFVVDVDVE